MKNVSFELSVLTRKSDVLWELFIITSWLAAAWSWIAAADVSWREPEVVVERVKLPESVVKFESPTASIDAVDVVSIVKVVESISICEDGAARMSPDAPDNVREPDEVVILEAAAASIETEEVVSIVKEVESISIWEDGAANVSPHTW